MDPLERLRSSIADRLGTHYAVGDLSTGTFELRVERAVGLASWRQARELMWDLGPRRASASIDGVVGAYGDLETAAPRASWILGRSRGCEIQVLHDFVSRRHARIVKRGACWTVEDLGSTNGTWVNGRRVQRARLRPGDEVRLGEAPATLRVVARSRGSRPC